MKQQTTWQLGSSENLQKRNTFCTSVGQSTYGEKPRSLATKMKRYK